MDHLLSKDDLEASRHRREADIGPVPHLDGPAGSPRGFPHHFTIDRTLSPPARKKIGRGGEPRGPRPRRISPQTSRDGPGPLATEKSAAGGEPGNHFRRNISRQLLPLRARGAADGRAAPPPGRRPAGATTTRATRAIPRGTGPGRRGGVAPPFRSFTIRWLVHTSNVWSWQLLHLHRTWILRV